MASIRQQDYQGVVEIITADGGSTDGTKEILGKYNCKIVEERSGNPERAKAVALKQARGELVLLIASDNILPKKNWLKIMVNSLIKEPRAVAAYPWRYAYRKEDTSLNRYFALMGANDPVAWFMGKADRKGWGGAEDKVKYRLVKFTPENMPTLGDNGVLVWREKLLKAQVDEQHFSHIDVFYDIVSLGMNQFVVVNKEIIHDTGESLVKFLRKRFRYMKGLYLGQLKMRRYKWIRGYGDALKLGGYCIYSLTVVGPVITATKGWLKKPDWAWFWQVIMAPAMAIVYGLAFIL